MKRLFVSALVLLASASVTARADEAHDLAADIVARTDSQANLDKTLDLVRNQMAALIMRKSGKASSEAIAIVNELIMPRLREALPRLSTAMIDIRVKDYDLADLRALDSFYRSPAGQHMLTKQAQVAADTTIATSEILRDEIDQITRDEATQLHQRGVSL